MTRLEELLSISSEALGGAPRNRPLYFEDYVLGAQLLQLLEQKNGFYAFEQALHIFPIESDVTNTMTMEDWNSKTLWLSSYKGLADGFLCFGEDIFGDQFCLAKEKEGVLRFDAERGEATVISDSLESWADLLLSNYHVETGWPLASEWQKQNGPLQLGTRLQPKVPFICGGDYSLQNLWPGDAVQGMLFKGELAVKLKNLADGTAIELHVKGDK